MTDDRCSIHRVSLEIDALRGLVCPACDAALDDWSAHLLERAWRACRRLGREALDAVSTSHDPWSD